MNNISNVLLKAKVKAMAKMQCSAYAVGEKIVSKLDKEALNETMKTIASVTAAMGVSALVPTMAGAANAAKVDTVMKNLKSILVGICAAVGGVLLVLGIFRLGMGFKNQDQQGLHNSVYTLVAAGILIGGSGLVTALGI